MAVDFHYCWSKRVKLSYANKVLQYNKNIDEDREINKHNPFSSKATFLHQQCTNKAITCLRDFFHWNQLLFEIHIKVVQLALSSFLVFASNNIHWSVPHSNTNGSMKALNVVYDVAIRKASQFEFPPPQQEMKDENFSFFPFLQQLTS